LGRGLGGRLGGRIGSALAARRVRGIDLADGRLVLALGIAVLLLAGLAWMAETPGLRSALGLIAVAGGAVIATLTLIILALGSGALAGARAGVIVGLVQTSPRPGLYVALAGGVVALIGGATGLARTWDWWGRPKAAPEAPSPQPLSGSAPTEPAGQASTEPVGPGQAEPTHPSAVRPSATSAPQPPTEPPQ
jgi:hypothetical protein